MTKSPSTMAFASLPAKAAQVLTPASRSIVAVSRRLSAAIDHGILHSGARPARVSSIPRWTSGRLCMWHLRIHHAHAWSSWVVFSSDVPRRLGDRQCAATIDVQRVIDREFPFELLVVVERHFLEAAGDGIEPS